MTATASTIKSSRTARPARRRSFDGDHEDCLSFSGGCGPQCPYNFRTR